jgi:exodeoxyribonuclease VII large subunit
VDALATLQARQVTLQRLLARVLQNQAQRIDTLALRLGQPARTLAGQHERLLGLQQRLRQALVQRCQHHADDAPRRVQRLQRALAVHVQRQRAQLDSLQLRLQALDPQQVLQRGYAWVEGADGRPVVSALALRPGQTVRAVWADGRAQAQVLAVEALPPAA